MTAEKSVWKWKEGYSLALAPVVGIFCVNRYEAGRFAYLGIPSELIDLPIARLIAGGSAIVLLAVLLISALAWSRNFVLADKGWKRFLGSFIIFGLLITLPTAMMATTLNSIIWALLITLSLAFAGIDTNNEGVDEAVSDKKGTFAVFVILSLYFTWLIYSYGFFSERMSVERTCLGSESNAFIAGFYGDKAIIKSINPQTNNVRPGVKLLDLSERITLTPCKLHVRGHPSILDEARKK